MKIQPAKGYLLVAACEEPFTHGKSPEGILIQPVIDNMQIACSVVMASSSETYPEVKTVVYHSISAGETLFNEGTPEFAILHESQVKGTISASEVEAVPIKLSAVKMLGRINDSIERRKNAESQNRVRAALNGELIN